MGGFSGSQVDAGCKVAAETRAIWRSFASCACNVRVIASNFLVKKSIESFLIRCACLCMLAVFDGVTRVCVDDITGGMKKSLSLAKLFYFGLELQKFAK